MLGALPASASSSPPHAPKPVKLNVLFIGAHPDDEAFSLATYGQWNEYAGIKTGVITVTRGEGGGNAAGPEEGAPLGLLREAEERSAVGMAGVQDIFNLDRLDFFYTVSAPLTEQVWGHDATLEKIVRIVRETRPDIITTMNPAPSPGQHGNHQYAGRLAIEAFQAAADPNMFPEQLTKEHLQTWRVKRLFRQALFEDFFFGPSCAAQASAFDPTGMTYGIFTGTPSAANGGTTWAQIAREAQRKYVSQGWAGFPDQPTDPNQLLCDEFIQIESRVPFTPGNSGVTAMLEGASQPAAGGLPLGTEFWLEASSFDVVGGDSFTVTAHARRAGSAPLRHASVALNLPAGWTVSGTGAIGDVKRNSDSTVTFTVTAPADATVGRVNLDATLSAAQGRSGTTRGQVRVVPAVTGELQRLPQVAQFETWAPSVNVPQLTGIVKPVLSIGQGESRPVRVDVTNHGSATESGSVALTLAAGFSADAASKPYGPLAPGDTTSVEFTVTNTDASLPLANAGPNGGDYQLDVTTTGTSSTDVENDGLELVPSTVIPQATTAPTVDGVESPGEYSGPTLDLSPRWEGDDCTSPADCSGSAKVSWNGDDLYLVVHVTDDVLGTVLDPSDCKRHWRTDSVEIAIDPRNNSENTGTTFKTGIFPTTTAGTPCFERDADNRQGPGAETAPGMQVASVVSAPYAGYTLEVKIPLADVPAAVDPADMGLNIFIYDSDTQDKTGQTRLGWSTFGGVQGDPYRWGHATLPGYTPPADRPTVSGPPVIPNTAAASVDSPQSILQASHDGVALAGDARAARSTFGWLSSAPTLGASGVHVSLATRAPGTAHVFVWTNGQAVASTTVHVTKRSAGLDLALDDAARQSVMDNGGLVLIAWEADSGGTVSWSAPITS